MTKYAAIPAELRERPQWVVWRRVDRDGRTTKVPYRADGTGRASSTDPATWATFEAAAAAAEALNADGIGYVFAPDDPFVGIDLDEDLSEPDRGAIMAALDSYTERSVSGVGLHVFVRASLNGHGRNRQGPFEVYEDGRYFVVTGDHVQGTPTTIEERQAQLEDVLARYLPAPQLRDAAQFPAAPPVDVDDQELLERARAARNGADFAALWAGDWQGRYSSQSEADLALCGMLAFWSGRDPGRIDRLFRASGLMRAKWNRDDYRDATIGEAVAGTRDVYRPGRRGAALVESSSPPNASHLSMQTVPPATSRRAPLTDVGNGERLVERHGHDLRYVHPWGKWLAWDGTRWRVDESGEAVRRMKDVLRALHAEALGLDDEPRRKLAAFALASEREPRVRAAISLAQSEPGIPVLPDELDADPWALNVANGRLDLRTGRLHPHRRSDLITRLAPIGFHPDAACPTWDRFLARIFDGDTALIEFLRRAVGYTLTGLTVEQVLILLHGSGANGKTTLIETLRALFGDYGQQAPAETFLERRDTIPNDVARLRGARLVAAVETPEGRRLNETLVKRMTGGDTLAARFMRGEWFEFRPAFTAWVATNHKPEVRGTDEAIWRRVRLVPFTVTIPAAERDAALPAKLRAELPGILAWAIRGCLQWQHGGLDAPEAVTAATEAYRGEMDVLGDFLAERCVLLPDVSAKAAQLYRAYVQWCDDGGVRDRLSQRAFGMRLAERGFQQTRDKTARWWRGISVRHESAG